MITACDVDLLRPAGRWLQSQSSTTDHGSITKAARPSRAYVNEGMVVCDKLKLVCCVCPSAAVEAGGQERHWHRKFTMQKQLRCQQPPPDNSDKAL